MTREFERHRHAHWSRRRRIRRLLRALPRRATVRTYPVIRWFAEAARRRPWLWSFKSRHVVPALYAGAVTGLLPVFGQLLIGFGAALLLRANYPLIAALCFIANPLTMVPVFTATYVVGHQVISWLSPGSTQFRLGEDLQAMTQGDFSGTGDAFAAMFVGAIPVGLAVGALLHLLWRVGAWEARVFRARLARLRGAHRQAEADAVVADRTQEPAPAAPPADDAARRADESDSR